MLVIVICLLLFYLSHQTGMITGIVEADQTIAKAGESRGRAPEQASDYALEAP